MPELVQWPAFLGARSVLTIWPNDPSPILRRTEPRVARTDMGNLDPDAIRLVYADRPISDEVLTRVATR